MRDALAWFRGAGADWHCRVKGDGRRREHQHPAVPSPTIRRLAHGAIGPDRQADRAREQQLIVPALDHSFVKVRLKSQPERPDV
jgi:hypothetical protein